MNLKLLVLAFSLFFIPVTTYCVDYKPTKKMELHFLIKILLDNKKFDDLINNFSNIQYSEAIHQAEGELILLVDGKKLYKKTYSKMLDRFFDGEFLFTVNKNSSGGYHFGIHQVGGIEYKNVDFYKYISNYFSVEKIYKKSEILGSKLSECNVYKIYNKNRDYYIIVTYYWLRIKNGKYISASLLVSSHRSPDELFCGDRVNIK